MKKYGEVFVAFDTAKKKHAVAIADAGRDSEVRYLGEIDSSPHTIERVINKLARRYEKLQFCYEAGPTGYGLHRQIQVMGYSCSVVAPGLIPKKANERVKTNRRDAVTLARLFRAGELSEVWVPDAVHEADRDLVRARETVTMDLRKKRQQLLSFLLRHGRIYTGRKHWTHPHALWLADQKFDHPAQQIVLQDAIDAADDALTRLRCFDEQLRLIVPSWSMAPVVEAYQAMPGVSFVAAVTFATEIGDVLALTHHHIVEPPLFLPLAARCFGLMGQSVPVEAGRAFKQRMAERIGRAGAGLERHFPQLNPGDGVAPGLERRGSHRPRSLGCPLGGADAPPIFSYAYPAELDRALLALWGGTLAGAAAATAEREEVSS